MLTASPVGPTQRRVLARLADSDWHGEDELRQVSRYARDWIEEIRRDGVQVEELPDGRFRLVVAT